MSCLLLSHLAVTWMLAGLIWVVQVLVYPQFLRVGVAEFKAYHFAHCFRIGIIVAPLLAVEAGTGAWLFYQGGLRAPMIASLCLMPAIWLTTAFIYAPAHTRLMQGFDAAVIRRLILTNWLRTLLWTARGVLVAWALCSSL